MALDKKIVYFVINLNKREKEIKKFVRNVEKWIIAILNDFNISSYADPKNIGIWVKKNNEENKIAAIGIKVKKWIAYHGFSLNINVNKSNYRGIVPCGILNKGILNSISINLFGLLFIIFFIIYLVLLYIHLLYLSTYHHIQNHH